MKVFAAFVFAALSASAAIAGDLDVARAALRDGLFDIARRRAEKAGGADAKVVEAESLAREGRWEDVLSLLSGTEEAESGVLACHKALALSSLGRTDAADKALAGAEADGDGRIAAFAAALRAKTALEKGDAAKAAELAKKADLASAGDAGRIVAAEALAASGDAKGAAAAWNAILALDEPCDEALAAAACALGDAASLSNAYSRVSTPSLRRAVGVRLGAAKLASPETFEEGEKLVRDVVREAPDTDGAKEAFCALADACAAADMREKAADAWREALETWPELSRDFAALEGRAWSLLRTSRHEEAAAAFARAAEAATDDAGRARALVAQGDALAEAGQSAKAMEKYREAIAKYPSTPSGLRVKRAVELADREERARALYADFKFAEAMDAFAALAKDDPSRKPRMDYFSMLCLYGLARDAEASQTAKNLAAGSPDAEVRAEAALWLAKFFYNSRRWTEAADLFSGYATNLAARASGAPAAMLWAARSSLAGGEFRDAASLAAALAKDHPGTAEALGARLVQGEALVELGRLDEAVVALSGVADDPAATPGERLKARTLKADSLFVMGADAPSRYREALSEYNSILLGEDLDAGERLVLSFKAARTLERLGRMDEAEDRYYGEVVCAYRDGRRRGERFGGEARAAFARAAFRLADEYESRGDGRKAAKMMKLVVASDLGQAAAEARRRLDRIRGKGMAK